MCGPALTQKGIAKKLGKQMAEQGYTPNMPIVLVPGMAPYILSNVTLILVNIRICFFGS